MASDPAEAGPEEQATSASLLAGARDNAPGGWSRFVAVYGPVVLRKCQRAGFGAADAEDITQQVFIKLFKSLPQFRREPPHYLFRKWLSTIVRTVSMEFLRQRQKSPAAIGGDDFQACLQNLVGYCDEDTAFSIADNDMLIGLRATLDRLRSEYKPENWQAFWRTTVEEQDTAAVALELGLTADNVRQIKSRVLKRLQSELSEYLGEA